MKKYIYNYQTVVGFNQPVSRHAILLRAQPAQGAYMNIEEEHLLLPPSFHIQRGTDQLGNRIVYGCEHEPHSSLVTVSTGIVSMSDYQVPLDAIPLMAYREPTPLTYLSQEQVEEALAEASSLGDSNLEKASHPLQTALSICHFVHETMSYVPDVTTSDTPVSELIKTHQGVCQDFAQLMISLCRLRGIPARYACGFMEGEGETHAWVEACDGHAWYGFDPTNDVEMKLGYVKLAHGRDASDCPVSRGIYMGNALQNTEVSVLLKEI